MRACVRACVRVSVRVSVCVSLSFSLSVGGGGRGCVCACVCMCLAERHDWQVSAAMQVQKKVQQLQESIKAKREDSGQRRCVCAFVTFKTEEARLKCMQANPSSVGASPEAIITYAQPHGQCALCTCLCM